MKKTPWYLSAILVGCTFGAGSAALHTTPEPNPVRFYFDALDHISATEFVAEGKVYTAKHVTDHEGRTNVEQVGHDIVSIAPAGFEGFGICREAHRSGSIFRVLHAPWPGEPAEVEGVVMGRDDNEDYLVRFARPVFGGSSGSPVVCSHGEVVGCVSRMWQDRNYVWVSSFGEYREPPPPPLPHFEIRLIPAPESQPSEPR